MRLAKYIAGCGICSRRAAEDMITERRVRLDGEIITDPARDVSASSIIELDGRAISMEDASKPYYLMFHKPVGVESTMSVVNGEVMSLHDFIDTPVRVFPVGRLDMDSSGLMLLMNDGELANRLTHPRYLVSKEYHLKLNRSLNKNDFRKLNRRIEIDGRTIQIDRLEEFRKGRVAITIHEGRKRILRKLMGRLNLKVIELKRVKIGPVSLGSLGIGNWRKLTGNEIVSLKKVVGMERLNSSVKQQFNFRNTVSNGR